MRLHLLIPVILPAGFICHPRCHLRFVAGWVLCSYLPRSSWQETGQAAGPVQRHSERCPEGGAVWAESAEEEEEEGLTFCWTLWTVCLCVSCNYIFLTYFYQHRHPEVWSGLGPVLHAWRHVDWRSARLLWDPTERKWESSLDRMLTVGEKKASVCHERASINVAERGCMTHLVIIYSLYYSFQFTVFTEVWLLSSRV